MSPVPDSAIADPQGIIANLQRELAECRVQLDQRTAELSEALDQQTATVEVLEVINASPGDRTPVFEAILEKARVLCGAAHGSLSLYDGERFRAVAINTKSLELPDRMRQGFSPSEFPYLTPLLDGARFVQVPDLAEVGNPYGARTGLFMPLRKDDALLGLIATIRLEIRPFSDKEIALVENFAAQAVIAMENARLITETREALEQQTATAEVLGVINASPGDLAPVFDAMLDKALDLCGAAFGNLWTYDGTLFRAVALRRVPKPYSDYLLQTPIALGKGSVLGKILAGKAFAQVADAADDEAYQKNAAARSVVELGGARTIAGVPLRQDESLLGAITIYRQEVRPFTDKQITLLQNFAAQAVIAMENARLITETRQRSAELQEALEYQTATSDVLKVINSSPGNLAPVFDAILEKAHSLCGVEYGTLRIYDGEKFSVGATRGYPDGVREVLRRPYAPEPNSPFRPLLDGAPLVEIPDITEHRVRAPNPRADAAIAIGIRSVLLLPLRKDNLLLGLISAARKEPSRFTEKQIALLQNFAAQAVIAMENARLLGELRQRTDEVAELNRGLEARVVEQVEELGRIGRLKRFLAPQLAELIVSQDDEKILESHRREIVVVFCDLRGYTAFTETAEPEEVLNFLREYHGALGPLVSQFEGTLDQFSGDGIMVFFNDPVPIPDAAERAVKMAVAMREASGELIAAWRPRGCELGFGVGIAQGYATLGQIGFADRSGYTAIGTVCNLAARLCAEAKDGQILLSGRVATAVAAVASLEEMGNMSLKGLSRPVAAFNVRWDTRD